MSNGLGSCWVKNATRLILIVVLAPYIVGIQAGPARAASGTCYLIGGSAARDLSITDLSDTNPATNETTIGGANIDLIEVGAVQPGTGGLFSSRTNKLGTIDIATGVFSARSNGVGSQPGSDGIQTLNQMTGLAFDPTDGVLFAVNRRAIGPDLLFQADPTTGVSIPDAFGPGVGYVQIISDDPAQVDFYGIAIAADGQIVGMGYDGTSQWKLHTIDKVTGAALAVLNSSAVADLSYDSAGTLWGVAAGGTLFDVFGVEPSRTVDNLVPYSAVACPPVAGNQTPVFSQDLGDRSDPEGMIVSISAGATDPDLADTLSYSATGLPPGLSINPTSGLITGTITYTATGSHAVTITVTDNGSPSLNATDTLTWTVADVEAFYAIADSGGGNGGDDLLTAIDPTDFNPVSNEASVGTGTGTTAAHGADFKPGTTTLYAGSGATLGTIDITTGIFTAGANPVGTVTAASQGSVAVTNIEAIAFDATTGALYVVQSQGVWAPSLLLIVDPATGLAVPNSFGPATDYVEILPQSGAREVLALAVDPTDGQMFGVMWNGVNAIRIVRINKTTGATTSPTSPGANLIAGLSFDQAGQLWGVTEDVGSEKLFDIDKTTLALGTGRPLDNGTAYAALAIPGIAAGNGAPTFSQDLLDRSDLEGTVISISAGATDPDLADTLTYSATNLPPGLTISPTTGAITGTIANGATGPYAVTITVTDNGVPNLNATDTFAWTVTGPNQNPAFSQDLLDRSDAEGAAISLSAGATDPDLADTLTYSATNLPPGLTINPTTGTITGAISYVASGSYAVTITVTDDGAPNLNATDTFTWTVTNTNQIPVFNQDLLDRSDAEGTVISLSAAATDPDVGDSLGYLATGLPPGLTINPITGLITGTISNTASGSHFVTISAIDHLIPLSWASDTFTWTVTEVNQTPAFGQDLLDRSNAEGAAISLSAGASDPDLADTLTYSATNLPPGLTISPTTGLINGTITYTATGTYPVTITVTDDGAPVASATDTFTWTITEQNQMPTFGQDLPNRWDAEGTLISISAGASDPDPGDTLTYSATNLPPGLTIDSGSGLISGTITYVASGSYPVTVTVTDDGAPVASATDTFTWTITEQNQTPAFGQDLLDRSDPEGSVISLSAGANDPDVGDTLGYSATGLPPGLVINPTSGLITGTITYVASGSYPVTITVTDNGTPNASATDTFTWTVTETNQTPAFGQDLPDRSNAEGTVISLSVGATDPDPADTLTYSATGLPPGLTINAGSGLISGTITYVASGSYPVTITVTDDGTPSLNATGLFTWTITETNQTPAFGQDLPNRWNQEGTVISLSAAATDPDPADTLTYSATGLPPGLSINASTGLMTGTITYTATGTYPVTLTITDDGTPNTSATDTFTWTITEQNQTPEFNQNLTNRSDSNGAAISLSVGATDPDAGDTLTYSATGLPPGLTINATTGLITGKITYSANGAYSVAITVTDDGTPEASATELFTWTVNWTNLTQTPVIKNQDPIALADDFSGLDTSPISIDVLANDSDPDTDELGLVSFDDSTITHGKLVDLGDGQFSYTPQIGNGYSEFFTYTITDGWGGFATATATITITSAEGSPAPPIAEPALPVFTDDGEPPLPAVGIPTADQIMPGVIGGQESAQRKGSLMAELADFQSDSTVVVAERGTIRRTLVVLGRVSFDTFETMGPSLALLIGLLVLVVAFGRIGLFPFLKRTRRLRGVVVWLDGESGYGFILPDRDQAEVFFHQIAVGAGDEVPAPGDQVSYRMVRGGRRDFAFGVRSVQAT